jgi:hypothetical protein
MFNSDNSLRTPSADNKSYKAMDFIPFACAPLVLALYAVYAWCTQSFLATAHHDDAMRGLDSVRWQEGKWLTAPFPLVRRLCQKVARVLGEALARAAERRAVN